MKNKKWLICAVTVCIIAALWFGGVVPKQIAKIYGTSYVKEHFTEMRLVCTGIEWADAYGDYLIAFEGESGKVYRCVIGPRYFPVSLGQGLLAIEKDYAEYEQ